MAPQPSTLLIALHNLLGALPMASCRSTDMQQTKTPIAHASGAPCGALHGSIPSPGCMPCTHAQGPAMPAWA